MLQIPVHYFLLPILQEPYVPNIQIPKRNVFYDETLPAYLPDFHDAISNRKLYTQFDFIENLFTEIYNTYFLHLFCLNIGTYSLMLFYIKFDYIYERV